jgi:hypothetical protein
MRVVSTDIVFIGSKLCVLYTVRLTDGSIRYLRVDDADSDLIVVSDVEAKQLKNYPKRMGL